MHAERILYRDDHLLAVSKLSGELVVKGKGKVEKLPLLDFLRKEYPGLRALHRLDFETSGVVLFARTKEAEKKIVDSGFEGWTKVYRTIVLGPLRRAHGTIDNDLPARGKGTVKAFTRFSVLERFQAATDVECVIETGRHHQIRRHFALIGHPLILDNVYGNQSLNHLFTKLTGYHRFFLHAARLELPHPVTGERLRIEAPLPRLFKDALKKMTKSQ